MRIVNKRGGVVDTRLFDRRERPGDAVEHRQKMRDDVLRILRDKPGMTVREVGDALGGVDVQWFLKAMEEEGLVEWHLGRVRHLGHPPHLYRVVGT